MSASKETYKLNLVTNECARDTDMVLRLNCFATLSPVLLGGKAYFVNFEREIQAYNIVEKKWEIVK